VRHTVTALHYDRQITVVATDRSLRMNVRREFFVELPSLITIAPAEEPSLPVELDAQPA
jgi:hypothetical protein